MKKTAFSLLIFLIVSIQLIAQKEIGILTGITKYDILANEQTTTVFDQDNKWTYLFGLRYLDTKERLRRSITMLILNRKNNFTTPITRTGGDFRRLDYTYLLVQAKIGIQSKNKNPIYADGGFYFGVPMFGNLEKPGFDPISSVVDFIDADYDEILNPFEVGLSANLGVSFKITDRWSINLETMLNFTIPGRNEFDHATLDEILCINSQFKLGNKND